MFTPTRTQEEFLYHKDPRLNFLVGSVRSGKTYISLIKWALFVGSMPKDAEFIMVGKTLTSLKRNCLFLLQSFVGESNFTFSVTSKSGKLFGRTVWLEGANDERSENKIRGMTLAGAYCDEVTLFPESFFTMLLTRLSYRNAKLYATCNPDNPNHYIKTNYIDNKDLDCKVWTFLISENFHLGDEYIKNISKEFTGVYYNRFVLGQWVRPEGVIYTKFVENPQAYIIDDTHPKIRNIISLNIGVDFGGSKSATAFVCTGFTRHVKEAIILESERITDKLSPDDLERRYAEFVNKCTTLYGRPVTVFCDSAEQILIRGIYNKSLKLGLPATVKNALKMPINERIRLINKLIGTGRLLINKRCPSVIKALQDAVWAEDTQKDERLDDGTSDIDTLDAMEYSIEPNFKYFL